MNNALIVHAHSQMDSFVTAMKDVIARELAKSGYAVKVSDFHAKGFNPVASAADFGVREHPDHLTSPLEHGELATGMMRHLFQGTLGYVGIAVHEPFVAHNVPDIGPAAMTAVLADLADVVTRRDGRPVLHVPDLADFDNRFAPMASSATR